MHEHSSGSKDMSIYTVVTYSRSSEAPASKISESERPLKSYCHLAKFGRSKSCDLGVCIGVNFLPHLVGSMATPPNPSPLFCYPIAF